MKRQSINNGQRLSPSARKIIKLRQRAFASGGASLELQIPTNYIRDISRKLNYDITSDASLIMTPNTIGEGRLFNANPDSIRNLQAFSEDYTQSNWVKQNITLTSNIEANPVNGQITVSKLLATATSATRLYNSSAITTISSIHTCSLYVKKIDVPFLHIRLQAGGVNYGKCVDLTNGILLNGFYDGTNPLTNPTSFSIIPLVNGYYRVIITLPASTSVQGLYYLSNSSTTTALTTANTSILIYGIQIENNSVVSNYQKTLNITDGIIDFQATRATTATVVQKDGSVGDSCYNLVQRSEDFTNAFWSKNISTVTTLTGLNPFNVSTTLNKIIPNSSPADYQTGLRGTFSTLGGAANVSAYFKAAEYKYGIIMTTASSNNAVFYDIELGTVVFKGAGVLTANIEIVGNGWVRCSATYNLPSGNTTFGFHISGDGDTAVPHVGDGVSGGLIFGTQVTYGNALKDYLKTTNRLNVPSIDYSLGSSLPALLVEPQRANLLFQSQSFNNSAWTKTLVSVTPDFAISPTLDSTADKLIEDSTANNNHSILQNYSTPTNGLSYSFSVFIKKFTGAINERKFGYLHFATSGTGSPNSRYTVIIDSQTGATSSNLVTTAGSPFTNTSNNVLSVGSYWKLSATVTFNAGTILQNIVGITDSLNPTYHANGYPIHTGDGVSYIVIFGAQLEQGSNPTSYIPTTTATVTRNAYNSYVDLFNNSLLNKDNFTLYVEGFYINNSNARIEISLNENTGLGADTNYVGFFDGMRGLTSIGGVLTTHGSTSVAGSYYKAVIQYANGQVKYFRNGVQIGTTQSVPVFDYRYLTINCGSSTYAVQKLVLWKHTKTDEECLDLTQEGYSTFAAMAFANGYAVI